MRHSAITHSAATAAGCVGSEIGPVILATRPNDATQGPRDFARWFAEHEERELHVVTVSDSENEEVVEARMREELGASPMLDCQRMELYVRQGEVASAVVQAAQEAGARAIVVGTGRHGTAGRVLYGERAMQIIRASDRPVVVIPPHAPRWPLRHALVAVDFGPSCVRAARAALPMLSRTARITLLHARDGEPSPGEPSIEASFNKFRAELDAPPGITVDSVLARGDRAAAVLRWASHGTVDLIACGTRRLGPADRMLLGSTSEAIVRGATCAVLVAPAPVVS